MIRSFQRWRLCRKVSDSLISPPFLKGEAKLAQYDLSEHFLNRDTVSLAGTQSLNEYFELFLEQNTGPRLSPG
ncbi:hypothetical protein SBDP1_750011 [Syntrophobacter sp. SbD1]|nr:hypothetical protein SBDP1_750011 [Syntrophobacter sp. SbD1]